jgi:hypothetical protein
MQHAIAQAGPWAGENISVTIPWLISELTKKINEIDWDAAKQDVERFLKAQEALALTVWSKEFFLSRVKKLAEYLAKP